MAYFEGHRLILNEEEQAAFIHSLAHPDQEAIRRRDALFARLDQMEVTVNADGSRSFEFTPRFRTQSALMSTATGSSVQIIANDSSSASKEVNIMFASESLDAMLGAA